jgi:hypothetical protein
MVVVLPWHNPLRVVEDVTQLDYYSGGRAILGIGRGLGAMEFGGFGIEMSDTRDMFVEKAETVVSPGTTPPRPVLVSFASSIRMLARRRMRPTNTSAGICGSPASITTGILRTNSRGNASFNALSDIRLIIARALLRSWALPQPDLPTLYMGKSENRTRSKIGPWLDSGRVNRRFVRVGLPGYEVLQ